MQHCTLSTGPGTERGKGWWARRTKDMVRGVGRERGGNLICRAAGRGGRGLLPPPALLRARDQSVVGMLVSVEELKECILNIM